MTRADTLQVAAHLLGEAAGKLGQARDCFHVVLLPGSEAETARLAREVGELERTTSQAADTARAAEPPVVRIVPPGTPGRLYGQGYGGGWDDEGTAAEAARVARENHNNDSQNDDGKGQD